MMAETAVAVTNPELEFRATCSKPVRTESTRASEYRSGYRTSSGTATLPTIAIFSTFATTAAAGTRLTVTTVARCPNADDDAAVNITPRVMHRNVQSPVVIVHSSPSRGQKRKRTDEPSYPETTMSRHNFPSRSQWGVPRTASCRLQYFLPGL